MRFPILDYKDENYIHKIERKRGIRTKINSYIAFNQSFNLFF